MKAYSDSSTKNTTFPCPRCKKPSTLMDNPSKPFCSERCKLIDLGAWANEDYKVSADDASMEAPMGSELDRF